MKISNVKAMVVKSLTAVFLGAALMVAGPAKAEAQSFAVGVQFGGPHYGYGEPGFVARRGWEREEFARQQEFAREQAFAREREFARDREFERQREFVRHEDRDDRWPAYGSGYYGRR